MLLESLIRARLKDYCRSSQCSINKRQLVRSIRNLIDESLSILLKFKLSAINFANSNTISHMTIDILYNIYANYLNYRPFIMNISLLSWIKRILSLMIRHSYYPYSRFFNIDLPKK